MRLGLAVSDEYRGIRPTDALRMLLEEVHRQHHVEHGNPSVMHTQSGIRIGGLHDRVGREGSVTNHRALARLSIASGPCRRSASLACGAPCPASHRRRACETRRAVNFPSAPQSLNEQSCRFMLRTVHYPASPDFIRGLAHAVGGREIQPAFFSKIFPPRRWCLPSGFLSASTRRS